MGIHPSNIASGVAAVNSTMAMAASARLGGLTNNNNRHQAYSTTNHQHNQNHNPQVLPGMGAGIPAYGVIGSNLSSTSSSSGVGTITNNSSSNGSNSGATGTASGQAPPGSNNSYNHQSLPRHFLRGGAAVPMGSEEETNCSPSSGIVMGPSHHPQSMNNQGQVVADPLGHQHTHHTHHFKNTNGSHQPTHNGIVGYYPPTAKKGINMISTVSNGMYDNSTPQLHPVPNSRFLNQQQNPNFQHRSNQQQNRTLSSYYSTLRSQPPPPPLPSQNSSLYNQAVPANINFKSGDQHSTIQPPKQFDSYYYHPATVGRGSPAFHTTVSGGSDRQRPNSSGAVIDVSNQMSNNGLTSSRSSNKIAGGRVAYTDLSPQQDPTNTSSHQTRSSSALSTHGTMVTPPIPNSTEYAILKFNPNNIGKEIDV